MNLYIKLLKLFLVLNMGVFLLVGCGKSSDSDKDTTSTDKTAPVITIIGSNPLKINQGEKFSDLGATALDETDGTVTVVVTGTVDTSTVGSYTITYTATDKAGNSTSVTRNISVVSSSIGSHKNNNNWQYEYKDMQHTGDDNNSYTSANSRIKSWEKSESLKDIRLGDVTGDGKVDIVGLSATGIKIFDKNGTQQGSTIAVHDGANHLILEDIDGDKVFEMIVGSSKNSTTLNVKIYKYDGSIYKTFTRNGGYDFAMMKPIAYLGNNRLVIEYSSDFSTEPRGYSVWDTTTGAELWYYDVGPITVWNVSILDINNDGLKELVIDVFTSHNGGSGSGYNGNGTYTSDGDLYTIVINENGQELFTQRLGADSSGSNIYGDSAGSNGLGYHTFADMNGDGNGEIVAFVGHDTRYYQGTAHIKILDNSGTELHAVNVGYNAFYGRSYIIADLDNNGKKEIIINAPELHKFLIYDHELNLIASLDNVSYFPMLASDIDGDGIKEIVVRENQKIHALSLKGTTINTDWSLLFNSKVLNSLVSDIDGDKRAEVIVKTENGISLFDMN